MFAWISDVKHKMTINHPQSTPIASDARRILFLITESPAAVGNDNHEILPRVFEHLGWQVEILPHEDFTTISQPDQFDLLWPVGFGPRRSYEARLQSLAQIPPERFINAPLAVHRLHSKAQWLEHCPTTHVSDDAAILTQLWLTSQPASSTWVLKPEAGSYGRAVTLLTAQSEKDTIYHSMRTQAGTWLMQRYLPGIALGEKRTLICGGELIDSYLRIPEGGFKANLSLGANSTTSKPGQPDAHEQQVLHDTQSKLSAEGIDFAAVDTCDGYLVEVNVTNPGGLSTINRLHSWEVTDPESATVRAVTAILKAKNLA